MSNNQMKNQTKEMRKMELIARMRSRADWRPSNAPQTKRVAWSKVGSKAIDFNYIGN